jgi:hypothetical protein
MYIRFLKLNPHCAFFILLQALYRTHSKKNLPYVLYLIFFYIRRAITTQTNPNSVLGEEKLTN